MMGFLETIPNDLSRSGETWCGEETSGLHCGADFTSQPLDRVPGGEVGSAGSERGDPREAGRAAEEGEAVMTASAERRLSVPGSIPERGDAR